MSSGAMRSDRRLKVSFAGLSDKGRRHAHNQDAFQLPSVSPAEIEDEGLFVVADGVGGRSGGQVASALAARTFYKSFYYSNPALQIAQRMGEAFRAANQTVIQKSQEEAELDGMATTLVAAYFCGDKVFIGAVGDSRLLRIRQGQLDKLTRDHSLVAEWLERGLLTPQEAQKAPFQNVITRAIGKEEAVWPDLFEEPLEVGDWLILCSDGLFKELSDEQISRIVLSNPEPEVVCERLVVAANHAGGRDNITAVVLKVNQVGQPVARPVSIRDTAEALTQPFKLPNRD